MNMWHQEYKNAIADSAVEPHTPRAAARIQAEQSDAKTRIDDVAQTEAIRRRTLNAGKAVEWLDGLGIRILDVKITRHAAIVRICHTPFLHRLFANECAWRQQRQEGNTTILTWFALRYATRIEWEETTCQKS